MEKLVELVEKFYDEVVEIKEYIGSICAALNDYIYEDDCEDGGGDDDGGESLAA